jgi:exonuclease SbcC
VLRAETGALSQLVDEEVRAEELSGQLAGFERTIVALDAQSAELTSALRAAPATGARLEADVDIARSAQAQLPGLAARVTQTADALAAAGRRDDLEAHLARQHDELRVAVDQAQAARQQALDVREKRLLGMAAELAGTLAHGTPCGVCGSPHHPRPAQPTADAVTEADETAAERQAVSTDQTRAATLAELTETEVALAQARSIAGQASVADLRIALAGAEAAHLAARISATACSTAENRLQRFRRAQETHIQRRMSLEAETQRVRERTLIAKELLADLHGQLTLARGSDFSVRARLARVSRLAANCEALAEVLHEADNLRGNLDAARKRAEEAAAVQGIPDLPSIARDIRDEERLAELEEHRARYVAELASVNELLADPVLRSAGEQPPVNVAALRARMERADAEHQRRVGEKHGAQQCAAALARLSRALDALLASREPLAAHHDTVDHLSRLVEGKSVDNRLRMSLAAYVLAARLEQVAAAASERLLAMTSGRYSLLHTDDGATGRGGRGGLRLRVFDAWTGSDRDPATLSGGESFAASLALALGLAHVVTAEAGGSLLETLFVDEGFGSLDEETLDDVMGMLDNLRDGGRVIGVVSHVADLRQRIPTQLHVVKGRRGSSIRQ